jgi:hypothetical protein
MKPNTLTIFMLAVALLVAAAIFRQEREVYRLRAAIAELTRLPMEEAAASKANNPLPADNEELRREADEVHRLRSEIVQLRREKEEAGALQAKVDELARDLSAIRGNLQQRSDSVAVIGGFNAPAPNASPMVLQASSLAQSSPEEAARWVAALPPGNEQDQAALAVIGRWTNTDPVAAAAWTAQFADGPLRDEALSYVARQWGLRDWNATAGWLETLPVGQSKDAAIGSFVTAADGNDIRLAVEWANQTESPDSRLARVEETTRRWLREDEAAARAWLATAQLPAGLAERLLPAP